MPESDVADPSASATLDEHGEAATSRTDGVLDPPPGTVIGRYVVISRVGAGAMGVVHAAYDPELDRKVALKLLRDEDGDATRRSARGARMLREAQALAKLSHPNVVVVHDVGASDGRVWLAMEFVAGQTLGEWLRAQPRSWREVLEVLRPVASGLSAAHDAGLVHRDVKPENIMLESGSGEAVRVRVMDFGLARSHESSDREEVPASDNRHATARAGTPGYMAPEQWMGLRADPRSDQFAFCVVAWEALFASHPFTGVNVGELATSVLAGALRSPPRGANVPAWLRRVVRRGLERDPEHRHASMAALLSALDRGRAAAGTRGFAAVAVLLAMGVGLGFGARALARAGRARACEAEGAAITQVWNADVQDRLRTAMIAASPEAGADAVDRMVPWFDAHAAAWREAAAQSCLDAEVHEVWSADTRARSQRCLEDRRVQLSELIEQLLPGGRGAVDRGVRAAASFPSIAPCRDADVLAQMPAIPSGAEDAVLGVQRDVARARALSAAGAHADFLALARQSASQAIEIAWLPLVASTRYQFGRALEQSGDFAAAEDELVEAYFAAVTSGATDDAVAAADYVGFVVGVRLARPIEGLRWSRQAGVLLASLPVIAAAREADHLSSQANIEFARGAYEAAEALHERALELREAALGADHPNTATSLNNLGNAVFRRGDRKRAADLYARACELLEHALGPTNSDVPTCLINLAAVVQANGDVERAIPLHERALALLEATVGPDHPSVAGGLTNLAAARKVAGDDAAAEALNLRALAIYERALGSDHPTIAHPLLGLAEIALNRGELGKAIGLAERALALRTRPPGDPEGQAEAWFVLARAMWESGGDRVRAQELARDALRVTTEFGRKQSALEIQTWLDAHAP